MQYFALLFLALLQVVLNVILWRKRRSSVSKIFTIFTGFLLVWTVTNGALDYLVNTPDAIVDQAARIQALNVANALGFFSGTLMIVILYRFILVFPSAWERAKGARAITALGILVACGALFGEVTGWYTSQGSGLPLYHYGRAYAVIPIYFLLVACIATWRLFISLRQPIDPFLRRQAKTILTGLLFTGAWAISFIIILPPLFVQDSEALLFIGYFAPYIFTAMTFYSILRQGFLNYRAIVARSAAYILSLSLIALSFMVVASTIVRALSDSRITTLGAVLLVGLNVLTALAFPLIRRFFDRITNRLFYHDAYDSQDVLNKLSDVLVRSIDVGHLQTGSRTILLRTLRAKNLDYWLAVNADKSALSLLDRAFRNARDNVVVLEELEGQHDVVRELQARNIAAIVRLRTRHGGLGYFSLGFKESGQIYNIQDKRLLNIAADEIAISLQNALHFEEIQNFNETLQERVQLATKELRHTNERLKELDDTKDEFISMASHQLRTPLTSVKGYLSMVLEGDAGKITESQRKLLEEAFAGSQRMAFLIGDFLNASRLRTGKFVLERRPVNLAMLAGEAIDQMESTAASRSIKLAYDAPSHFPNMNIDAGKISQALTNFIDNAIYYSPEGSTITIELTQHHHSASVKVKDKGMGVPKPEQHRLFTKFYRASNARKIRPDGTGIGLFMAKKVVVAHGGSIIFESKEGEGSTFGFSLPL